MHPGPVSRLGLLACILITPFLKFVAWNEYGFLHLEVVAAAAILLGVSVISGLAMRGPAFYAVVLAVLITTGTAPFVRMVAPAVVISLWQGALLLALGIGGLMVLMQERFLPVLMVFTLAGLAVEVVSHLSFSRPKQAVAAAGRSPQVLWLILDEQIGLAGFPETGECQAAARRLSSTLEEYDFEIYPDAYSNYAATINSIPSVLNQRLLREPRELITQVGQGGLRQYRIRDNLLIREFAGNGYRVIGYEHASLRMCDTAFGASDCRQYSDKLARLHRVPGSWLRRMRWLVANYQASDPWLQKARGFFPFRFGMGLSGPLGVTDIWPDRLAADILAEPRRTLFFAHLLTPHAPYLYHRDGSIRPLEEWSNDRADQRVGAGEYAARYRRYCEQADWVATQLDHFLGRLRDGGAMANLSIVIHGDHGSRIRRFAGAAPGGPAVDEDAEQLPPAFDQREMLNHFSTLLAIRKAGATRPSISSERHSLLTLLARHFFGREPADGERADHVYMLDSHSRYQSVDFQSLWR